MFTIIILSIRFLNAKILRMIGYMMKQNHREREEQLVRNYFL